MFTTEEGQFLNLGNNEVRTPLVKDLMTSNPFTLLGDDNIFIADELMKWKSIRHIPVTNDKGYVEGILSHRDILKYSISLMADVSSEAKNEVHRGIPVNMIMKKGPITIDMNDGLAKAARLIYENKLGCLLVTEHEKLVGIITEADFVKFFFEWDIVKN